MLNYSKTHHMPSENISDIVNWQSAEPQENTKIPAYDLTTNYRPTEISDKYWYPTIFAYFGPNMLPFLEWQWQILGYIYVFRMFELVIISTSL